MRLSVGDELFVQHEGVIATSPIVAVRKVEMQGLFNPYTRNGDIFVNNILASSHSGWFLEGSGMSDSSIVAVYSALFSPLSMLYSLKPSAFACFHGMTDTTEALNTLGVSTLAYHAMTCLAS